MTKYVLFDLDGTLNDPYEGITNCIKYALSSVGIEENDPEKLKSYTDRVVHASMLQIDYAGERDHALIELSEVLPSAAYVAKKIN